MLLSGELSGMRFRQRVCVLLELEINRMRIALGDQPSLYFQNLGIDTPIAATRSCENAAKLNQPPFLTGHLDKAVHVSRKIATGHNIVPNHVVLAKNLVESRRIKTSEN